MKLYFTEVHIAELYLVNFLGCYINIPFKYLISCDSNTQSGFQGFRSDRRQLSELVRK